MKKYFFIIIACVAGFGCAADKNAVSASGTVEIKQVDVASMTSSRVVEILKSEGSFVNKGEIVVKLDDTVVKASRDAAATVLENAKLNYERAKDLYASNAIAKASYEQAQAAYLSANAAYASAEKLYNEAAIKAPWSGTIMKIYAEEGELVSANSPVFTLGDLGTAKVSIYVPLKDMSLVKHNDDAEVTVDAYPQKKFKGKVNFISSQAEFTPKNVQTKDERVKQVFRMEVTVDNKEGFLKPGIPADVVIKIK